VGAAAENGKFVKLSALKAYNVLVSDCIVGYSLGGTPSRTTVGLYTANDAGIAYSDLNGNAADYTGGSLGKLIGGAAGGTVQVVGLSIQGECYPYQDNGNQDLMDSASYIIYGDYTGTAVTATSKPNVVGSPVSALQVGTTFLTSDGTVQSAIDRILGDATGKTTTQVSSLTYHHIATLAAAFTSGTYAANLSGYYDASESAANDGLADFPVLVVDSILSADITKMVNSYISVLTNWDQTKLSAYTDIQIQTYQWTASGFTAAATNSLKYNATSKTLSVNGAQYDNQKNQFTLLDVRYQNPGNAAETYHLYVPVVVKRVLQVDFAVKMQIGSSTYTAAYLSADASKPVLASYGDNYTTQLTYSYTWTAAEWNHYIASGNSLFWSYDKQVQLGDAAGALKDSGTRFTLVDPNRLGAGDTYFRGTGSLLTSDEDSDAVLEFSSFADFESVPLCDLLTLTVSEDENGALKVVSESEATLRIWNGTGFTYYGPRQTDDPADTQYYTAKMADAAGNAYGDTASVTVQENYYLIVNCTNGSGVNTKMVRLGRAKLASSSADALPTRTKSSDTKYYTLGDFYSISDTAISTASESANNAAIMELISNDYIDVTVSAQVTVSQEEHFKSYASGADSYFRFAVRLSDGSGTCDLDPASVAVESVTIGNNTLTAADYTGELIGGVYYLTITSQKADAYANQTVKAKLRFSYENDADRLAEQFPVRQSTSDTSGVSFLVNAAIAYSQECVGSSSMNGTALDTQKYYREKNETASVTYNAYNTVSEDGNTSQLGINGRVVNNGEQKITSLGMYNASQISDLNLTDKKSDKYPATLVCTLTLEKKTDTASGAAYQKVDIQTYLKDITIPAADKTGYSDGTYQFTVPLTDAQVAAIRTEQVEVDISYNVKSDTALEALGDVGQYANYRVTLTAHLENPSGTPLAEDVSDYLIYTNAKFYLGIIATSDLGQ
jgi:hypothetical protein